jgi:hypothetical protein
MSPVEVIFAAHGVGSEQEEQEVTKTNAIGAKHAHTTTASYTSR